MVLEDLGYEDKVYLCVFDLLFVLLTYWKVVYLQDAVVRVIH